jgi:hypothetical protein
VSRPLVVFNSKVSHGTLERLRSNLATISVTLVTSEHLLRQERPSISKLLQDFLLVTN